MYKIDFSKPARIYFVGIGGISMSGLAEILQDAGFTVLGSDRNPNAITEGLEAKGIKVFYGQKSENITSDIDCVVFTSAIRPDNPEYIATMDLKLPYLSRGELLGQLMTNYKLPVAISGTHGKTTTTSMVSEILLAADTDPTLSIGGVLGSIGGNIRVGGKEYFVTEACEYTNSFLSFFPKISVILNVEEDHMDFFKDLADIRSSFTKFAQILPEDGALVINSTIDDYKEISQNLPCKVITFGPERINSYGEENTYYPTQIVYDEKGCAHFRIGEDGDYVKLGVPGAHNVLNALAAIACADLLSIDREFTLKALASFTGTDRRFQLKGDLKGITIIDDYAHHPTEIKATLTAARNYPHERLVVVFQPHTYTRTKAFLDDFAASLALADKVILADIYAARETDTLGVSSDLLREKIQNLGTDATYLPSFDEIENFLLENCRKGDVLITMGAGNVYKIGESLLGN